MSAVPPPTLVALRALGLGDLCTALPALRALAAAFPGHRRVLLAPTAFAPLLPDGLVDAVVDVDLRAGSGPAPQRALPVEAVDADVAVNLHGRGPQSHRLLLGAGARRLIAYAHPSVPESARGPVWQEEEHEVLRWCRLLAHAGMPADPDRLELTVGAEPAPGAAGATIVHPGAASAARRWPVERWAAVAAAEAAEGRRVVVTGSAAERPLAESVAQAAGLPADAVLAGRTDLVTLAATVAAARRLVCGDTGVAHLGTATGTPSVVLFGPTPPSRWGPPPDRPWHRALWRSGHGDPHADEPDPGLLAITVEDVLDALASLPDRALSAR